MNVFRTDTLAGDPVAEIIIAAPCVNSALALHAFKEPGDMPRHAKLTRLVHLATSWADEIDGHA